VLQATRRATGSGGPIASSNGPVWIESAPAAAAANVSVVPRSRLTHGSRAVRVQGEVRAWITMRAASSDAPEAVAIRCHRRRAARSAAMARKKSSDGEREHELASCGVGIEPAPRSARR